MTKTKQGRNDLKVTGMEEERDKQYKILKQTRGWNTEKKVNNVENKDNYSPIIKRQTGLGAKNKHCVVAHDRDTNDDYVLG